jgi:hypothetical protein
MQSSLYDDRNLSIFLDNRYAEDSGSLMIRNTDDNDDSFYLECGDCYFNISNLVSEGSVKVTTAPVSERKQTEERMYPSLYHVESIGDVDIGMVFAKARLFQSTESAVGHDEGRGPSTIKPRDSTSGYFAKSEGKHYYSSNGILCSRSLVLINSH